MDTFTLNNAPEWLPIKLSD